MKNYISHSWSLHSDWNESGRQFSSFEYSPISAILAVTSVSSIGAQFVASYPGVCGGNVCIAKTRLPLWTIYRAMKRGTTNTQLRKMYPQLSRIPLKEIREYAELHKEELNKVIHANEQW